MIASIFPFFADDRSDLPRPAVLPDIFFADVHGDPLVSVPLLFELRFSTAAPPLLESPVLPADAGPFSFFGPDSSHNSDSVALLVVLRRTRISPADQLRDTSILSQKRRFSR